MARYTIDYYVKNSDGVIRTDTIIADYYRILDDPYRIVFMSYNKDGYDKEVAMYNYHTVVSVKTLQNI